MSQASSRLNFLVFGAGAIGGYLGGSLAAAGYPVIFLARGETANELRKSGLRVTGEREIFISPNEIEVITLDEDPDFETFDVFLFALKAYDTAAALDSIRAYIRKVPPVVCFQNGIGNEEAIAKVVGAENVIAGTVTTAVSRDAGRIRVDRLRGVGLAAGHPLSQPLANAMTAAGLNARLYPDGAAMKWSKLLANILTNARSAILNKTPAEVVANRDTFRLELKALRETLAVMKAMGLEVTDLPGLPMRALAAAARLPAGLARPLMARGVGRGRGDKMPSLHIDLHSGTGKSEVEWLNGAVVRAGERLGVPTPVNRMTRDTLLDMIRAGREGALDRSGPPRINTNLS